MFSPTELIEKLAAIIPPPRFHQLRYHGILAPNAKYRSQVVPKKPDPEEEISLPLPSTSAKRSWAQLLKHVHDIDMNFVGHHSNAARVARKLATPLLSCPSCGGEIKIVAFITDPCEVNRYLLGTGQSIEAPSFAPARASPTLELSESEYSEEIYAQEAAYQDFDEIQHHPDY